MKHLIVRRAFCKDCHAYVWRLYYGYDKYAPFDEFNSWQDAMDEVNLIWEGRREYV